VTVTGPSTAGRVRTEIVAGVLGARIVLPAPSTRTRLVVIVRDARSSVYGAVLASRERTATKSRPGVQSLVQRLAAAVVALAADDVPPGVEQDEVEDPGEVTLACQPGATACSVAPKSVLGIGPTHGALAPASW
jgi:hypothetical protein